MKKLIAIIGIITMAVLLVPTFGSGATGPDVCPSGNGWVKIDSGDLSQYPVDGAEEYCFKTGQGECNPYNTATFDHWPVEGVTCDLSHWSYRAGVTDTPRPSDTPPVEPTVTSSPQAPPTCVPENNPTGGQCTGGRG